MTNRNYSSGADYERHIKKFLEGLGFIVVRSAGSHGCADLVAFSNYSILFIQAKHYRLSEKEKDKISEEFDLLRDKVPAGSIFALIERYGKEDNWTYF